MKLPADRLSEIEARFKQVEQDLQDPAVASRQEDFRELGKEYAELRPIVEAWTAYRAAEGDLAEAKSMLPATEGDERTYLEQEIKEQQATIERLEAQITEALIPKDPNDERDVIIEIRAGAGGDEAGLFAQELFRMYSRYAEDHRFRSEVLASNPTGVGGLKDVTFSVKGSGAFSRLKHEAGVHRVQRVPVTESSGRIHTSAAAVNVLPEADEVDVEIDMNDLKIDVYRSSGPGGQSVNTTDSAVRITHLPTNVVVAVQDEKSQLQNKEKALRILRAKLLQQAQDEQAKAMAAEKRAQVSSADRSAKIRTYNFPDGRVTDHRIGFTSHRLSEMLEGDLDELIDALLVAERSKLVEGESS